MKAVMIREFGDPDVLVGVELPVPEPRPGEVLVRVHASSINRPDLVQREGRYPPPPGDSEIPGVEVAGVIERLAKGSAAGSPVSA